MAKGRVNHEPAFLLKTSPYKETSLIAEFLTLNYGRIAVVAKGAKRPMSQFKSILFPFQELLISFSGVHALKTLTKAEWRQKVTLLNGREILCGFYLNELCLLFLPKEDAHPAVFHAYAHALKKLEKDYLEALFMFEKTILAESGYDPDWQRDTDGLPIAGEQTYLPSPGKGFMASKGASTFSGKLLHAIHQSDFSEVTLKEARLLLTYFLFANHRFPKTLDLLAEVL